MYIEREIIILFSIVLAACVGFIVYNLYRSYAGEQDYQRRIQEADRVTEEARKRARDILKDSIGNAKQEAGNILKDAKAKAQKESSAIMEAVSQEAEQARDNTAREAEQARQQLQANIEAIDVGINKNRQALLALEREIEFFSGNATVAASGVENMIPGETLPDEETQKRWAALREKEAAMVREGSAVIISIPGSRKRFNGVDAKRILRNFNSDCDCCLAWVKTTGANKAQERIRHSFEVVNKLYEDSGVAISPVFLAVKLEEVLYFRRAGDENSV